MTRESLPLVFDCPMDWNAMSGDDQRRYCGECRKHVMDLSACGNAAEAQRMLESAGPSPCIRYTSDAAGRVVFRGPRTSLGALALLASMAAAAGCETQAATVETVHAVETSAPPSVETAPPQAAPAIPTSPVDQIQMETRAPTLVDQIQMETWAPTLLDQIQMETRAPTLVDQIRMGTWAPTLPPRP